LTRSMSQEEEDDIINHTLFVIFDIIESCWVFREDLGWPSPKIKLRTGIKLLKDLNKFETSILNMVNDLHWKDQEYNAQELKTCLKLIIGLLKRHDVTIKEISKLHHEIASNFSENDSEAEVDSYKTQMDSGFEEIESIRTTLKVRLEQEIRLYADAKKKKMTDLINDKKLVEDDDDNPSLMKYIDEECAIIFKNVKKKYRRSQIILALWKVMEEEMLVKLNYKKDRNFVKNKPSRFHLFKEALNVMMDVKKKMKDDDVIDDLELDRLDKMFREVLVLSEDTNILISKVLRKKAEKTVVDFNESVDNNKVDKGSIKLKLKLAFTPGTQRVLLKPVHATQVPLREEGKKTNIQLTVRLISDNGSDRHQLLTSEIFKDVNTSYLFEVQAAVPPVFQLSLDELSSKKEFADAFIIINIFHVNRTKALRMELGECVIQLKKNGYLLPELEKIHSADDIEDVSSLTYSLADFNDVYLSEAYKELSNRNESAAKKIVDKDKEYRKKKFSIFF